MPFDANGTHSLPSGYLATTGQTIQTSQHNPPMEDISAALSQTFVRDGRAAMTGDLAMGSHRITGLLAGVADTDAVTVSQLSAVAGVAESINNSSAKSTPVDADRFVITDSAASYVTKRLTWANIKTALSSIFALQTTTISGSGLVSGGGDLSANRTLTVTAASEAQALAGTLDTVAMTPLRVQQAIDAAIPPSTAPSGSWVSIARTSGTTYTNSFEKDIAFRTAGGTAVAITFQISPDGTEWITELSSTANSTCVMKVPAGWKYRYTTAATGYTTSEYR